MLTSPSILCMQAKNVIVEQPILTKNFSGQPHTCVRMKALCWPNSSTQRNSSSICGKPWMQEPALTQMFHAAHCH